jgi:hypothetical protein
VPYKANIRLFRDKAGYVAGKDGSSGEKEAEIYQELEEPGINITSECITVKVKK